VTHRVRYFPQKLLALTFDDGPNPTVTPQVLRTLAAYGAHATFFVIGGRAKAHPGLLRQMVAAGHAVGNHSWSHPVSVAADRAARELRDTAAAIRAATGAAPTCFRPPYGIIRGNLARTALAEGYCVLLWTISSADTATRSSAVIANNVIHTPNPGDIILMHDGAGHSPSAAALPAILKSLTAAGFRFVTVPELLRAWDAWLASGGARSRRAVGLPGHLSKPKPSG
jgi:chitin deacetylase